MKREKTYVDNRRKHIIELMVKNPKIKVNDLSKKLDASLITIRRDLQYLENKGFLTRNYGGATLLEKALAKEDEVKTYRKLIAKFAATFVKQGDSIFINSSSNAIEILDYIEDTNVTVITNNTRAIQRDIKNDINIVFTGGEIRKPKCAMTGDFAIKNLQGIHAKKAFIGCKAISSKTGITTEIFNEVSVNELMIKNTTQEVILLADHSKIGKSSSFTSSSVDKIKYLITDEKAPEEELEKIRKQGVIVYKVTKED